MATTKSTIHDVPYHQYLPPKPPGLAMRAPHLPWMPPRMMPEPPMFPPPMPYVFTHDPMPQPLMQRDDWQGIGFDMCVNAATKRRRLDDIPSSDSQLPKPQEVKPSSVFVDNSPLSMASSNSTKAESGGFDSLTSFTDFNDGSFALFGDATPDQNPEPESLWGLDPHLPELPPDESRGTLEVYGEEALLSSTPVYAQETSDESKAPAVSAGRPLGDDEENSSHSSHRGRKFSRKFADSQDSGEFATQRPALTEKHLKELNDISEFRNDEQYKSFIVDYHEGISFPLGEGGRELLRACLNVKGCKGRQLQGASVPALLSLAHQWGLWNVALRIKCEKTTARYCPFHDKFVKFKARQSMMRKYVKKEYMLTEREGDGRLKTIVYDENRKITLGKEGRETLRAQLRRLHDKHPGKMDELLQRDGFKYSELRNATVQQLSRMAFVCNLWDKVVQACRKQEEKRDGKKCENDPAATNASNQAMETESETSEPPMIQDLETAGYEETDLLSQTTYDETPRVKNELAEDEHELGYVNQLVQENHGDEDAIFHTFMENCQSLQNSTDPWTYS